MVNYLHWNNAIAEHFFNPNQDGKDVHLFITKNEIINIGKNLLDEHSDSEIWLSFVKRLKQGLPGSGASADLFDKALHCYEQWKRPGVKAIDGVELTFPPYIAYLVFSILPLTEIQGEYNSNNYYDRLQDFLNQNDISQNLRGKLRLFEKLWDDLFIWTSIVKNEELGVFKPRNFINRNWKFVGKPFSQCLFSPKSIRALPALFYEYDLIPNSFYSDNKFIDILLHGKSTLELSGQTLDLLKRRVEDELVQSMLELVKKEFSKWRGEQRVAIVKDGKERTVRKNTIVPLKLQFSTNEDGEISFSYRISYPSPPPPELKFDEFENLYENVYWSRTIRLPFKEHFELKDAVNMWTAKYQQRKIRLFIRAGYYQLSSDFWIEANELSRVEQMYILFTDDIRETITNWIYLSCASYKDSTNSFLGLPSGYLLFQINNPKISHDQIPELKINSHKKIVIRQGTGLRVNHNTFLPDLLPEIEIQHADGHEDIYLQYEIDDEIISLEKHFDIGGVWLLPAKIRLSTPFRIKFSEGNNVITSLRCTVKKPTINGLKNDALPKRNCFNLVVNNEITDFIQGNNIFLKKQPSIVFDWVMFDTTLKTDIPTVKELNVSKNYLQDWLLAAKECDVTKFNEIFEFIHKRQFSYNQFDVLDRRQSIRFLDSLGYVDYDFSTGKIFILPPKLVAIPSTEGKKAILLGARDENLINMVNRYCFNNPTIAAFAVKPKENQTKYLIPDTIIFKSNDMSEFEALAQILNIEFDRTYTLKLKAFIPDLRQYETHTIAQGSVESWERHGLAKKVFNSNTLVFESNILYEKDYTLTECRPKYTPEFGIWINNLYYATDKNWGRYLLVDHESRKAKGYEANKLYSESIHIYFNQDVLAIPSALPLPILISRLMCQLSGIPPEFKKLDLHNEPRWYLVYRSIPSILTRNFFRFALNMNIVETSHEL